MKNSARIATLSAILAVACAFQAEAARGIRTDDGSSWQSTCAVGCTDLSSTLTNLQINPVGQDPLAFDSSGWTILYHKQDSIMKIESTTALGNGAMVQIYLELSDVNNLFVEFNYAYFDENNIQQYTLPDGSFVFPTNGASLKWKETVYKATGADLALNLDISQANVFNLIGGDMQKALNFTKVEGPVTDVPEPGILGLLLIGAIGLGFALRPRRDGSPLIQNA